MSGSAFFVDGGGLNMTVMSYLDQMDFGLLACPDVVTDVGAQPVTSLPEHPSEMQGTWEQTTLVGDQDESTDG